MLCAVLQLTCTHPCVLVSLCWMRINHYQAQKAAYLAPTEMPHCRALATLQVVSGYRFSLQGRQAVESADTVLHAISRAPDSYLEKWGPPDSDGHRDEDAPEPELTFQALLQPGAGARGRSKLSSSAACTFLDAFDTLCVSVT